MVESQPPINPASDLSPLQGTFVGRQQELTDLKTGLEDTLAGQGRLVMLAGEPGIGKTRTAQELTSHAYALGAQVLWGRCYEEEGPPPYWPWLQLLRSYIQQQAPEQLQAEMGSGAADIAEIVPELREKLPNLETPPALEPEQARFRLFDSITTFFKNAASSPGRRSQRPSLRGIGSHAHRWRCDDLDDRRAGGAHHGLVSLALVRRRRGLDGSPRYSY